MGTLATLCIPGEVPEAVTAAVVAELRDLERRLTVNGPPRVRAASQVEAINAAAGRAAVQVDPEVYALLRTAVLASREHRASFNALIGPVVKAWGIGFDDARVPDGDELAAALALTDPDDVELDEVSSSVRLARAGMRLDLGAIAKGYAADRATDVLRDHGIDDALIDLGGNVVALGQSEVGGPWHAGIQSPFAERGAVLGTLALRDESAVTSGVYERVLEVDGRRYHHMIDPLTGRPFETDLAGVTVVAASSMKADLWATVAQAGGLAQGLARVAEAPGVEAVFVTNDGRVVPTPGIGARLVLA